MESGALLAFLSKLSPSFGGERRVPPPNPVLLFYPCISTRKHRFQNHCSPKPEHCRSVTVLEIFFQVLNRLGRQGHTGR